jgi:DNA-3-methyladenine glycosylase I
MTDGPPPALVRGADGRRRCAWGASTPDYAAYHAEEWGRPVVDDVRLYEKLCLEGFQAGLSWLTILRKRANFRRVRRLRPRTGRVVRPGRHRPPPRRHRASCHRGRSGDDRQRPGHALDVQATHGSLAAFVWSFAPTGRQAPPATFADLPAQTAASRALSKALLARGFRFVGPTTMYAAMQSLGLVNDHLTGCHVRGACTRDRRAATIPALPTR